jgi:uncharacterized alkaline shock family protein YloU
MEQDTHIDPIDGLEPIQEESGLGNISINNQVVATIVALAAREINGVVGLASGGIKDDLAGFFSGKRDAGGGVTISENAHGAYIIGVKLILHFGVQLAKVAEEVQHAVKDQVENMTNKQVSKVNVIVDGIRHADTAKPDAE